MATFGISIKHGNESSMKTQLEFAQNPEVHLRVPERMRRILENTVLGQVMIINMIIIIVILIIIMIVILIIIMIIILTIITIIMHIDVYVYKYTYNHMNS